jgi:hypothetical protein
VTAVWGLFALTLASVAANWWLWRQLAAKDSILRHLLCSCGGNFLAVEVRCVHVGGWHHGARECRPLHEEIP